jgi:hypothetical protein
MKVGDLVRLTGGDRRQPGLAIEMHRKVHPGEPWVRVFILFTGGCIAWEYDIDLEVINESG